MNTKASMKELVKVGKKMVSSGLAYSTMGNLSKRTGEDMIISASGCMLEELEGRLVTVSLDETVENEMTRKASNEINAHRKIYGKTDALAVLHGHSRYAVIQSLIHKDKEALAPTDLESLHFMKEIPMVKGDFGSNELAQNVSSALVKHKGVIVRGHGSFARGKTPWEALTILHVIENSSFINYMIELSRK